MKKLYIKTYGCQMNVHDSSRIADLMHKTLNMELCDDPADADLILLNTCSIRAKAEEKVFSDLGRIKPLTKKNPHLVVGVGGCVASQEGQKIIKRAPFVDIIFGPQTIHKIPQMYLQATQNCRSIVDISFNATEKFASLLDPTINSPAAMVSIMEGCNKYCSYCIVPFTRGKEISRPLSDVIQECSYLANNGVKEITFLGQNVNDYQGVRKDKKTTSLATLIYEVAKIDNIKRIRFTTSHPASFGDELIEAYHESKLVNHLHLPVQSGSNKILKAMRRNYTVEEFKEKIAHLRQIRPNIHIGSDFIVGFPGETEEDFQATMKLIKEINFDISFSFIYSPRPGTAAAKLTDNVTLKEKKQRLKILQEQLLCQQNIFSQAMVNTTQPVLVTGLAKRNLKQLTGRTECNRIVNFAAPPDLIGQIVEVSITDVLTNCLLAKI